MSDDPDDSVPAVVARLLEALEESGETYAFGGAIALAAWWSLARRQTST